jgi:hypothetical protein
VAWALGAHVATASGIIALLYYPGVRALPGSTQRLELFLRKSGRQLEELAIVLRVRQLLKAAWQQQRVVPLRRPTREAPAETPSASSEWGTASN